MKKFLSMVMAAAMVVSLVPATAFAAAGDFKATAKVVDAQNFADGELSAGEAIGGSELQLTLTTADTTKDVDSLKFTVTVDNVVKLAENTHIADGDVYIRYDGKDVTGDFETIDVKVTDDDEFEFTVKEKSSGTTDVEGFERGMVIGVKLDDMVMDKTSKGKTATVSVDSDDVTITNGDDLVFASVESKGIKASRL